MEKYWIFEYADIVNFKNKYMYIKKLLLNIKGWLSCAP